MKIKLGLPIGIAALLVIALTSGCFSRTPSLDETVLNDIAACTAGLFRGGVVGASIKADLKDAIKSGKVDANAQGALDTWVRGYFLEKVATNDAVKAYGMYLDCMEGRRDTRSPIKIDYDRSVDFRQLRIIAGKKNDVVIYEDKIAFSRLPPQNLFPREVKLTKGGSVKIEDLVAGTEFSPNLAAAGAEFAGSVNLSVDPEKKVAHVRWTYTNVHSTENEGVGFSTSDGFVLQDVTVKYFFPQGTILTNREIQPPEMGSKCTMSNNGFRGKNLKCTTNLRDIWTWNVWDEKK